MNNLIQVSYAGSNLLVNRDCLAELGIDPSNPITRKLEKNTKPYDTLIECEGGRDYIISKMPSDAVYDVFCNQIKITQ